MTDLIRKTPEGKIQLSITINESDLQEMTEVMSRLGIESNLRILLFLVRGRSTVEEVHEAMRSEGIHAYRESTYKALEKLRKVGLLSKEYDPDRKSLMYSLATG